MIKRLDSPATSRFTAAALMSELRRLAPSQTEPRRDDVKLGVRMRDLFDTAKTCRAMTIDEIEILFGQAEYEFRLAACCILDFKARTRLIETQHLELYELYLRQHDAINDWGMVDRAAPRVIGGYLAGRPLNPLTKLAKSHDPHRRRTAITAPLFFVKHGTDADLTGGFAIATLLAKDPEPVVHNAVGIFLKHAGRRDPSSLQTFLNQHAATMPRSGLRLAIEKLDPTERASYLTQ